MLNIKSNISMIN